MILIGIGLAAASGIYLSGRRFLKQAENKMNAMNVASIKMNELLTMSFDGLSNFGDDSGLTCIGQNLYNTTYTTQEDCLAAGGLPFDWTVSVEELSEGSGVVTSPIPYQQIKVDVDYTDDFGNTNLARAIHLENIVPYPYIHIDSAEISAGTANLGPPYQELFLTPLPRYKTDKDIKVTYNIALDIQQPGVCFNPGDCIDPDHTIYTECRLIKNGAGGWSKVMGQISRTAIISQPLFSNAVANNTDQFYLEAGQSYSLQIRWYRDTDKGTVSLKEGNLVVVAVDKGDF